MSEKCQFQNSRHSSEVIVEFERGSNSANSNGDPGAINVEVLTFHQLRYRCFRPRTSIGLVGSMSYVFIHPLSVTFPNDLVHFGTFSYRGGIGEPWLPIEVSGHSIDDPALHRRHAKNHHKQPLKKRSALGQSRRFDRGSATSGLPLMNGHSQTAPACRKSARNELSSTLRDRAPNAKSGQFYTDPDWYRA